MFIASWVLAGTLSIRDVLMVAVYAAPFCYAAVALLTLPILFVWPRSRRPSYPVAAAWGIVGAWVASALIFGIRSVHEMMRLVPLIVLGAVWASTGLLYARLVRPPVS